MGVVFLTNSSTDLDREHYLCSTTEIPGRLYNNCPLATDPGDDGRPVFVIMASTGLPLLTATTCSASQRLLPTVFRLPLLASGVIEFICFDRALHLTLHLIGQGTIAQPPAPAIAGPDMDAYFPGNAPR